MTDHQSRQEAANMLIASSTSRGQRGLREAVTRMREACDAAERELDRTNDGTLDARVIGRVLHELSWGYANATTSITDALAAIELIREAERQA